MVISSWAVLSPSTKRASKRRVQVVVADYDKTEATPPAPPTVDDADVQRVQDYITDPVRKPLTSAPVTSSVIPSLVTVKARIRPNTSTNREAATKELRSLFVASGIPGGVIPDETILATIARTYGIEAVELAELLQDGEATEAITLGYQGVAWLSSATFEDLVI